MLVKTIDELEDRLSTPRPELVADLSAIEGDIVVLGAGGKLGPSLVRLAVRAVEEAGTGSRVVAVSRFGAPGSAEVMQAAGAETVAADIADDTALAALPEAPNVIYLVGAKFGTSGNEAGAWETNAYLPGRVIRRYAASRIVALSTGNVYPLVHVAGGGAVEGTPPDPVGEYAMSCLGRERVIQAASVRQGTPVATIRLNYAVELRYGVLVDIASAIAAGQPVDLTMGHTNVVWQGYANEVILRSLLHTATPPFQLNLTGPETVSVRRVARAMAERMGSEVTFTGQESGTALLSDATVCHGLFGYPDVTLHQLIAATADWIVSGRPTHGKPTGFQTRDGRF